MDEKNEELIEIYPDALNDNSEASDIKLAEDSEITETAVESDNEKMNLVDSVQEITSEPDEPVPDVLSDNTKDDYASDMEAFEQDESDDEIIKNLSESINMQVELDLVTMNMQDEINKTNDAGTSEEELSFKERFFRFFKSKYALLIPLILVFVLFIVLGIYFIGKVKRNIVHNTSEYIAENVNYQEVTPVVEMAEVEEIDSTDENLQLNEGELDITTEEVTITPTEDPTPTPEEEEPEKTLINILLLGEENINSYASRGRTDLIDVLTIDTERKNISVTSILRDCKVSISGYSDNRINAVYAMGGVSLLYDTIEGNFDFRPDNYILVNFSSFESVIDSIGGVDIELSAQEAKYLNRTNYISNPEYRNMVEGMNHMNGNQALGYCRIRKVGTKYNEYSDFGRSSRHREVINAIFSKFSKMSFSEIKKCSDDYLSQITTDLDVETIEHIINMFLEIGAKNLQEYRIPIEGSYKTGNLRDMQVTEFNRDKNLAVLKDIVK